jgi:hypothetical protein
MDKSNDLHRSAMEFCDQALLARQRGDSDLSRLLFREAFDKESGAASLLKDQRDLEPTRSVLYRSAAELAVECGRFSEAKELVNIALEGSPPEEILEELTELSERAERFAQNSAPLRDAHASDYKDVERVLTDAARQAVIIAQEETLISIENLRKQIGTATDTILSVTGVLSGAKAAGIVNIFPTRYTTIAGKTAIETMRQDMDIERSAIRMMGISLGDFFLDRGNLHADIVRILDSSFDTRVKIQSLIVHPKSTALKERARWEAGPEYFTAPIFYDSTTYIETDGAARIARRLCERYNPAIAVKLYKQTPTTFLLLTTRFAFFEVYTYAARGSGVPVFQVQAGAPLYSQLESHFSRIWDVAESVEGYQPLDHGQENLPASAQEDSQ